MELFTWEAGTPIFANQIDARGAVLTRLRLTFVNLNLAELSWETYDNKSPWLSVVIKDLRFEDNGKDPWSEDKDKDLKIGPRGLNDNEFPRGQQHWVTMKNDLLISVSKAVGNTVKTTQTTSVVT